MARKRYNNRIRIRKPADMFDVKCTAQTVRKLKTIHRLIKRMKYRLKNGDKHSLSIQLDDSIFTIDKKYDYFYECIISPKGRGKTFKEGRSKAMGEFINFCKNADMWERLDRCLCPKVIDGHSVQLNFHLAISTLNYQ